MSCYSWLDNLRSLDQRPKEQRPCYATTNDVLDLGILLQEDIDWLEQHRPGIVLRIATEVSAYIDGRLAKRYGVPFAPPYDDGLVDVAASLTCYRLYMERFWADGGTKAQAAQRAHDRAEEWLLDATCPWDEVWQECAGDEPEEDASE